MVAQGFNSVGVYPQVQSVSVVFYPVGGPTYGDPSTYYYPTGFVGTVFQAWDAYMDLCVGQENSCGGH